MRDFLASGFDLDALDPAPVNPTSFRAIMGRWASGVSVVSTCDPERDAMFGLTATAVASLSLEPPLILVCIDDKTIIQDQIQQAACFGLSMLSAEQEWIARRFADSTVAEKFAAVPYDTHVTGAPTIEGALAWMDCQLRDILPGGDHKIFVGEPVCGDYRKGVPLLRYESRYITLDIDRDVTDP